MGLTHVFCDCWGRSVLLVCELLGVAIIPWVLIRRKDASSTIAWVLALVFLPGLGTLLFLCFGRDRIRLPAKRKRKADAFVRTQLEAAKFLVERGEEDTGTAAQSLTQLEKEVFRVASVLTATAPAAFNAVEVLPVGNDVYKAFGEAIDGARHHVHAQFYLIRNDETGAWFRDKLAAAARRGVEVRLLGDGYGCFGLGRWRRPLLRAGGKTALFLPMRSLLLQPVNLRNHRKILLIDGSVAFTGGMNIGNEYRGTMRKVGTWRDCHFKIQGPAARSLQMVFLQDWYFATREKLDPTAYLVGVPRQGDALIAVVPSGPDTRTEAIHRVFFTAIALARERVWISTPYFVPDQAMLLALEVAAMRGVEIKMILPSRSNHVVTFHAGRSFYDQLLESNVQIFEYLPGMIHAKTMVVDGAVSLVGSANMDMRSFRLNFEVHTLVHDVATAQRLEQIFQDDLAQTRRVELAEWRQRGLDVRIKEGTARLLSPLL